MSKLISVVIPVYHSEKWILDTIDSVLKQSYQNFEIVIVDDGSSDNTKNVIESIDDSRIKYIYQNNAGPSSARNNGIRHSQGEYIAFLDSDDLWKPDKLLKQLECFDSNPDLGIVSAWSEYTTPSNKLLYPKITPIKNSAEYLKALLLFPFFKSELPWTSCMMIKKECFEKAGYFDESMISKEDWDMWFRIALHYEFKCLDEVLARRKQHEQSLMSNTPLYQVKEHNLNFLKKAFANKNLPKELLELKEMAYSNSLAALGNYFLYNSKNPEKAKECFFESLSYSKNKLWKPSFIISFILAYMPLFLIIAFEKFKQTIKNLLGRDKL